MARGGTLDQEDRRIWIEELKHAWYGDSNLDGQFSSTDLVTVFQAGEYEDDISSTSTWLEGDWNGDAEFNSRDLVFAFQNSEYEGGTRALTSSVAEPAWTYDWLALVLLKQRLSRVGDKADQWPCNSVPSLANAAGQAVQS